MSDPSQDLRAAFDGHNVEGVRAALQAGADARRPVDGKLPIDWLVEEYFRSDELPRCLQLLLEHGAEMRDPLVLPVMMDDGEAIKAAAGKDSSVVCHRTSMVSAFTSLVDVTLLHVAAEYGNLKAAAALIEAGADVNAVAGRDDHGCNGHTPLFHTVNSIGNRSAPIMRLLVAAGADCEVRLKGIYWGKGYAWETTMFDVTPITYAQMGLLPQVHRREEDIYANIKFLIEAAGRSMAPLNNVPNRYLRPKAKG